MAIIKLKPFKRSLLLVIFVVFLSVAFKKAQFFKILAIVAPRYDFSVESGKEEREKLAYENWRHVAMGYSIL